MSIFSHFKESRAGQFWLKYEKKIVLLIGIILIAAISFEAGYLKGQKNKEESVIVNNAACAPCPEEKSFANTGESTDNKTNNNSKTAISSTQPAESSTNENQNCAFVASKNSNKYNLPTCRYAQNIKPENKICFSSKEEAESRGFQGAKCCIK